MIVQRIKDLKIEDKGFVTAVFGNTDDVFIGSDLCRYNFEEQLFLYLKLKGYERIYFYNRENHLYTYDEKQVMEALFPDSPGNNTNDGRPGGGGLMRRNRSNNNSTRTNIKEKKNQNGRRFYYSNLMDTALVSAILDTLNDTAHKSIFYFTSTDAFEMSEHQRFITGIENYLKGAATARSHNKILIHYSEKDTRTFLDKLNSRSFRGVFNHEFFINQFKSGNQLIPSSYFFVGRPDRDECENLINRQRIDGIIKSVEVFRFPYASLVEQLAKRKETIQEWEHRFAADHGDIAQYQVEEFSEELLARKLSKIHGQADNMEVIIDSVVTWVNRPDEKKKPLVMMFAGSTGVGKTYTAETIQESLASRGFEFVKIDMNEYNTDMAVDKLLGSAPGFVGCTDDGPLFAAREKSENLVILFDEIEKGNSKLFATLMTLMEKGTLSNGRGETYDFRKCIIIFTSNIAQDVFTKKKAELKKAGVKTSDAEYNNAMKKILEQQGKECGIKPEICGRINKFLVFNTLGAEIVIRIAIEELRALGKTYNLQINQVSMEFLKDVVAKFKDNEFGARPIKDYVIELFEKKFQQTVKNKRK